MTKDEIIRDEASEFSENYIEVYIMEHEGHKKFINLVKKELQNFYDPESKMIYIDQVKLELGRYISDYLNQYAQLDKQLEKSAAKFSFLLEQEFESLPKVVHRNTTKISETRTNVFISYSHKDKAFLDDLRRHFKPIEKYCIFWDDSKIIPGQKWKEEIFKAIKQSKIAILFLSADFFNSEFIENNELPPLLNSAEKEGATILSVILKPCFFEEYPDINKYQAINNPSLPISAMDETTRERTWVELVKQVKSIAVDSK